MRVQALLSAVRRAHTQAIAVRQFGRVRVKAGPCVHVAVARHDPEKGASSAFQYVFFLIVLFDVNDLLLFASF